MPNNILETGAYFEPKQQMFVVEFLDVPEVNGNLSPERGWSMFMHGICCKLSNNICQFDMIGITERHSAVSKLLERSDIETARMDLKHRLGMISSRLGIYIQEPSLGDNLKNLFLTIMRTLAVKEDDLTEQWIKSWQEQNS